MREFLLFGIKCSGHLPTENEKPRYGIIKPLKSYNLLWINTHGWAETWEAMRTKQTIFGKIRCIFGAPAMEFEEKIFTLIQI